MSHLPRSLRSWKSPAASSPRRRARALSCLHPWAGNTHSSAGHCFSEEDSIPDRSCSRQDRSFRAPRVSSSKDVRTIHAQAGHALADGQEKGGGITMIVVTTLDIKGLTGEEYRAVLDELGVEARPEGGIYLHGDRSNGLRLQDRRDLGQEGGLRSIPGQPLGPGFQGRGYTERRRSPLCRCTTSLLRDWKSLALVPTLPERRASAQQRDDRRVRPVQHRRRPRGVVRAVGVVPEQLSGAELAVAEQESLSSFVYIESALGRNERRDKRHQSRQAEEDPDGDCKPVHVLDARDPGRLLGRGAAHAWYAFREAGYEVTIASPDGGKCEVDAWSDPRDESRYCSAT